MANESIFEKTMMALQEAKKANVGKAKVVKENVRRKAKAVKKEELEDEIVDDTEVPAEAEGVSDDVVVVVDPELDSDDYEEAIEDAQEIIDNTPEGEQPTDEQYADDFVYTCPICGNTFFSENEMGEGDACPVCGDNPEAYVLAGEVETAGEAAAEDELADDELDVAADEEEVVDDVEDIEDMEEDLDMITDVEKDAEDQTKSDEGGSDYNTLSERKTARKGVRKTEKRQYKLDEKTFNPFLTKFVTSNYKNAKALIVKEAYLKGRKLRLECKLFFKSGKAKNVSLRLEGFNPAKRVQKLAGKDNGIFKVESKNGVTVAPFVFEGLLRNGVLTCTKLNYNFTTVKENRRFQISGKLIKESK